MGALLITGCAAASRATAGADSGEPSAPSDPLLAQTATLPTTTQSPPSPTSASTVTLRGWLSIVWNDQPHFFITDDNGETVEVLLDELLTRPLGGPLALDRSRVVVLAEATRGSPALFQALSIARELEG